VGRSSDSRISLLTAPSHQSLPVATTSQWRLRLSSPYTAAGPCPLKGTSLLVLDNQAVSKQPMHLSSYVNLALASSMSSQHKKGAYRFLAGNLKALDPSILHHLTREGVGETQHLTQTKSTVFWLPASNLLPRLPVRLRRDSGLEVSPPRQRHQSKPSGHLSPPAGADDDVISGYSGATASDSNGLPSCPSPVL